MDFWQQAITSLQWRHNERRLKSPVSWLFPQPFVQVHIKENIHVTSFCEGNSLMIGEFPAQKASNAKNFQFDDVIMLHHCWLSTNCTEKKQISMNLY